MTTVRDFLMPDLGEGLTEGEINRWLVSEGDVVVVDQPIAEITTEKAIVEVPTPFAGRVATLHGAAGDMVAVGKPLISIEVAGAPSDSASGNVLVGYGTSESAPRRRTGVAPRGDAPAATTATSSSTPPASPLVRRLAAEMGIDLATVVGSGPGGSVTQADLKSAGSQPAAPADAAPADAAPADAAPMDVAPAHAAPADTAPAHAAPADTSPTVPGGTRKALAGVDRIAAERLTRSHRDAPTATAWLTADATRMLELRSVFAESSGIRVTPFAFILRLCAIALQRYPRLNAHFDTATNEVVTFAPVHLGVAVQTERGLVVAVIRDAQDKPLPALAADLNRLADAARDGTIDASELRGSTFTVSNFGAFGVDGGTALINPPEAAILGVGQIATRPWVVGDSIVPRSLVELSLVFDHRVVDGGVAGGFIRHLANLIETADRAEGLMSND